MVVFRGTKEQAKQIIRQTVFDFIHNQNLSEIKQVYDEIGEALKRKTKEEFIIKARGGTDSSGIRWKRTRKFELGNHELMIATGALLDSLQYEIKPSKIVLEFSISYANSTLKKRPAWPDDADLSQDWWNLILNVISRRISQIIEKRLQG